MKAENAGWRQGWSWAAKGVEHGTGETPISNLCNESKKFTKVKHKTQSQIWQRLADAKKKTGKEQLGSEMEGGLESSNLTKAKPMGR